MKKIQIGQSGVSASAVVMGCMRIADMQVTEVRKLTEHALNLGINMFDHADIYGGGKSEELFGEMLKAEPSLRDKMLLQSKCGIRKGFYDLSKQHILNSADGILKRLNTESIDFLLLHRPDTLMEPTEIAEAFAQLYKAGKVRFFGVSNMNPSQIKLIQSALDMPLMVNQMQFSAARSGMIDSGINVNVPNENGASRDDSILEFCRLKGITMQAWSPLQYGFFNGVFLNSEKFAPLNEVLAALANKYNCEKSGIAAAWILRHPANMQVITGTTNALHLKQMAQGADIELMREEWYKIYCSAGNILP